MHPQQQTQTLRIGALGLLGALTLAPVLQAQAQNLPPTRRLPPAPVAAPTAAPAVPATSTPAAASPAAPVAATPAPAANEYRTGRIEVGGAGAKLSDDHSSWRDGYVRGHVQAQPGTTVQWGVARERHFDERGNVGSIGIVQDINESWYATAGVSGGSASYHNKYRGDVGVNHKWGQDKHLVTGVGVMASKSQDDVHRDRAVSVHQMAYLPGDVVVQGGATYNHSNPGSVDSARGHVAITQGREKQHYISARVDHGREAYLPTAAVQNPGQPNVAFTSTEVSVEWRQWLSDQYGYTLGARRYHNPYYDRTGVSAGVFVDF